MRMAENIILILGASFVAIGGLVGGVFIGALGGIDVFVMIPLLFVLIGLCFIGAVITIRLKRIMVIKKGKKYAAKIYGYVRNTSYTVNGQFTSDTKVHYFDENGIEREAVLSTGFSDGAGTFPVGMTIDIYEYNGKFNFDPKSVRSEVLFGEKELMDDKPIDPGKYNTIAVRCPSCGASFEAAEGYSNKCPYCGSYINA